jgi:hypothetical protein
VCDIDAAGSERLEPEASGVLTAIYEVAKRAEVEGIGMVVAAAAALGGLDERIRNAGLAGPTAPIPCGPRSPGIPNCMPL